MKFKFLLLCITSIGFYSCLGASADISIKADGSGKIALEYRVSQTLESIGRLDGNERWPAIPVGKADFERSLARMPGLRLVKFSSRDIVNSRGGRDLLTSVELDFKDTAALLSFLDSSGVHASFNQENNRLRLVLLDPSAGLSNPDLLSLLKQVSAGYEISISLSAPKEASLTLTPPSVKAARIVPQGRKVSFAIGLGDLISLNEGLVLEIGW